ncbi:probable ribonuclease ZC3H12C [Parasteatoda tepidariorum]|uniref:probable ribonuclease ZC3H12C n=1 Tax=Parasteatoda tepidariorum TaxID=114398 RepID=UPI000A2C01B7|nr:probable ribonuclease ZC3H12C [Parasteatoda tepidariorum]
MEDIPVSHIGHKILYEFKDKLESRHMVKILMPDLQNSDLCSSGETIFVKIIGARKSIRKVQRFLNRKLLFQQKLVSGGQEGDQSVIILNSDSEDENAKEGKRCVKQNEEEPPRKKLCAEIIEIDSVVPSVRSGNHSPFCEVTSTTNADESVIIIDVPTAEEFIPICTTNPQIELTPSTKTVPEVDDDDVVVISSDEEDTVNQVQQLPIVPKAICTPPKRLRPVVIDGSNVARAHGKPQNTFSCKGIKICVDYFLKKGHPQVTAFVPLFRRHCRNGPIVTTDQYILEELEKTQNVVFTPSRRVDGKSYMCYDDRFIVELAVANGGVILSNDNYKDLINESPDFAKTIKNRLLMYCFVGDMLMIPADPLGSKGPKLEEYLSFPPGYT